MGGDDKGYMKCC